MKIKILSYLSFMITFIGAFILGIELVISEDLFPEIDEFINFPIWYQIMIIVAILLIIIGLILSVIYRNKNNISKFEIYIEIMFFVLGFIGLSMALLRTESNYKKIFISIGEILLSCSLCTLLSTLIGLIRKGK